MNLLRPDFFAELFSAQDNTVAADTMFDHRYGIRMRTLHQRRMRQDISDEDAPIASFAQFVSEIMRKDVAEWQQSLEPWSTLVDRGFDEAAGSQLMLQIAMVATASTAKPDAGTWDENGFTATKGLVRRLFFARYKSDDVNWWRARLADVTIETMCPCLAVLLSWGTPDLITALKADVDPIIEKLSSRDWSRLYYMANLVSQATREIRPSISEDWFSAAESLLPRMALILIGRVEDQETARRLSRSFFIDYAGDDTQILRRAAQVEMMGVKNGQIDWGHAQHLSKRARQVGVRVLFPTSRVLPSKVPETVAKDVLSDCGNHCVELTALCEQAYAAIVAEAAPQVFQVAESDGWFASPM